MQIVKVYEYRIVSALASKGYPVEGKFLIYPKMLRSHSIIYFFFNLNIKIFEMFELKLRK